jgi:hypothetical protein
MNPTHTAISTPMLSSILPAAFGHADINDRARPFGSFDEQLDEAKQSHLLCKAMPTRGGISLTI